jgi:hypothetical protein
MGGLRVAHSYLPLRRLDVSLCDGYNKSFMGRVGA